MKQKFKIQISKYQWTCRRRRESHWERRRESHRRERLLWISHRSLRCLHCLCLLSMLSFPFANPLLSSPSLCLCFFFSLSELCVREAKRMQILRGSVFKTLAAFQKKSDYKLISMGEGECGAWAVDESVRRWVCK